MTAHVRIGDPVSCGDVIAQGSGNCFINGLPASRLGDMSAGHCFNPSPIVESASTVYFNNKLAAKVGNHIAGHTCGDDSHPGGAVSVGSPNCFVEDTGATPEIGTVLIDQYVQSTSTPLDGAVQHDDDEGSDPVYVARRRQLDPEYVTNPEPIVQSKVPDPVTISPTPPSIDCADIYAVTSGFSGSFQLSTHFTLAMLTTNTKVSNYPIKDQNNLSAADIVCNLRHLCINVLEPLYTKYGATMVINSGFRYGNGSSQHYKGQAVDVSFTDVTTTAIAWHRAQELPSVVPFDQYIFEQNRSVWYHFSYNNSGNRSQVLSKPRGERYYAGLVKIIV